MSGKELLKYRVILDLRLSQISRNEAAQKLHISIRQIDRLNSKIQESGEKGIVHGLVGRKSNNRTSEETISKVLSLWEEKYGPCHFNFSHFTQMINDTENVKISYETVRNILNKNNITSIKHKKQPKHRSWRERRPREGELVQLDTSPHDWLDTKTKFHLVLAIDDATSKILFAQIFEHDGTLANMEAIKFICKTYGLPAAFYTDRAAWFVYTEQGTKLIQTHKAANEDKHPSTQILRALNRLGIEHLPAHSAQAKGRVERNNGTLQDRLIAELKLNKIKTLQDANNYLFDTYTPNHNKRFSVAAADANTAWVTMGNKEILNEILCFEFKNTVQNDNTVSNTKYYKLQLLPSLNRTSWAKAKVWVRILTNGTIKVRHKESLEEIPYKIIKISPIVEKKYEHDRSLLPDQSFFEKEKNKKAS